MKRAKTLESKILARIARMKSNVFLRSDFLDLGGYDQIGKALKRLAEKEKLFRIGYGLYAKTKISALTGETVPTATLPQLGKEALNRLNIETEPTKAELAYNEGRSTQVPTGRMIGVKRRVSRKISLKGASINYEYSELSKKAQTLVADDLFEKLDKELPDIEISTAEIQKEIKAFRKNQTRNT